MKRMKSKKLNSALIACTLAATVAFGGLAAASLATDGFKAPQIAHAATTGIHNATVNHTYYIGSPEVEGDGSSENSVMSINKFTVSIVDNKLLEPGDVVKVMPGEHMFECNKRYEWNDDLGRDVYVGEGKMTVLSSGEYNNYIIFEAYDPSQKTTINFKQQSFASTNRGVQLYGNYIYWHDIDICGAGDNGMYVAGSYNIVENCEFYNNRDTGLQLGRAESTYTSIDTWPSYNLIKNCTSYNNYDNETYGENADGFAAKLTVGYGNIFDGCIAYRNSDDGWDLYAKADSGNIGAVIIYNCVAFENGFLQHTQRVNNSWYTFEATVKNSDGEDVTGIHSSYNDKYNEMNVDSYFTRDGDGNGFKLGGGTMEGDVILNNCMAFHNRMHGVTDNSNPGVLSINNVTSYNNGVSVNNILYTSVSDEDGNTTYNVKVGESVTPENYYAIDDDGDIVLSTYTKLILDEDGNYKSTYVSLDNEGYILNKGGERIKAAQGEEFIKGAHVKANRSAATTNDDFGKVLVTGQIKDVESVCNNIDIERTSASYNNFTNIVSVINGSQLTGSDRYKGSGEYSYLAVSQTKSSKIGASIDADYLGAKRGEETDALNASDLFASVPAVDLSFQKLTGSEEGDYRHYIHNTYREADGTINMGELLKIKDYSLLFGDSKKIGCDLTKTSYDEYTHYSYTYLTDESIADVDDSVLIAIDNLLYLPTNVNACYQDFWAPMHLFRATITWESSNPEVLKVTDEVTRSLSGTQAVKIECYRQSEDVQVKLTATIAPQGVSKTAQKDFIVTVKPITYEVGEVIVPGVVNDQIIVDQYALFELPDVTVTNATDYNGKLLPDGAFQQSTKILYSEYKGAQQTEVKRFTPSKAGVFEVVTTVSLNNRTKVYSYNVFVVSASAEVDFLTDKETNGPDVSLGVNYDGFYISGKLNNVAGTLYAMVAESEPTPMQLINEGMAYTITSDTVYAKFEADNTSAYTVYYVICNLNGDATSQIYSTTIEMQEVNSEDEFLSLVKAGGESNKIYQLTKDLDYTSKDWTITATPFIGYFDGQGHTIKGIVATASKDGLAAVFYQLDGGTVVNVNFDSIKLSGAQNVGIFGSAYSGHISNIKITNIDVKGDQRIGGLIGRSYEQVGAPLIIDRISLINTDDTLRISGTGGSARAGGIIGFMQNNGAYRKGAFIDIRISNCYVDAIVGTSITKENGGIFATYDDAYNPTLKHSLTMTRCIFVGTVYADTRCGGIIAYQKGIDTARISYCVSYGTLFHAGSSKPVETCEKNCSGIFGGYASAADTQVNSCFAKFYEHNQSYNVDVITDQRVSNESFWTEYVKLDFNVWELVTQETEDGKTIVVAPYVVLK